MTLTAEEIALIEKAINDRFERETQRLRNLQAAEINQLKSTLDLEIRENMDNLKAMQAAERDRFYRKPEEHSDDWLNAFLKSSNIDGTPAQQRNSALRNKRKLTT